MCKTYDAIYEIAKFVNSNVLICKTNQSTYEGTIYKCDCYSNDCKCIDGIITLKNAKITCPDKETKEFEWINISSKHIESFSFKCCENQ
jgi:small nuclear ribonucleoprotein (snRNP)-like protein